MLRNKKYQPQACQRCQQPTSPQTVSNGAYRGQTFLVCPDYLTCWADIFPTSPEANSQLTCPSCKQPALLRTAKKGPTKGNKFWGCSTFPKCWIIMPLKVSQDPSYRFSNCPNCKSPLALKIINSNHKFWSCSAFPNCRIVLPLNRHIKSHKTIRDDLEADEPDGRGYWKPKHRQKILEYVYKRDGERCGLCAGRMKLQGAQVEHIVPKIFAVFDISNYGRAKRGTRYKSLLHKPDNLQAAHSYCNKGKGNTTDISLWRHPDMPALRVATSKDGKRVVLLPLKMEIIGR